jgi:multiple sugar transport system permease protein
MMASLKSPVDITAFPPKWLFKPTIEHFVMVLGSADFLRAFRNSTIVSVSSLAFNLLIGVPAAYALARFQFKGKRDISFWILSTRMTPQVAVLIPFYLMFRTLRLMDSLTALIIMHVVLNIALVIWMMKGFFQELPKELEEVSLIDGCNRIEAFFRIMLPLSRNGIIATSILTTIFSWNELVFALVITGSRSQTAPVAIFSYITYNEIKYGDLAAAAVLIAIPVMIFVAFVQKYLIRGLTLGAVKQ